jgi:hypothetical protein
LASIRFVFFQHSCNKPRFLYVLCNETPASGQYLQYMLILFMVLSMTEEQEAKDAFEGKKLYKIKLNDTGNKQTYFPNKFWISFLNFETLNFFFVTCINTV